MDLALASKIEAVLFWKAEPVTVEFLAKSLGVSKDEVTKGLTELEAILVNRGLCLVRKDEEVTLGTHPNLAGIFETLTKEELSSELSKASLETLTIVLYRAPVGRAEIDYIRGVNSSFTLRHLQVRGLVERIVNPSDARSFLYRPTFELLSHLGIKQIDELPEFGSLQGKLEDFLKHSENETSKTNN
ncbi:MAG: SMC-Scp complex subunit ScpB [Patescibacteria group bacterium]